MEPRHLKYSGKKLLKVGLTGIFGSGKTTVGRIFEKEGIPYFSFDKISHEVLEDAGIVERLKSLMGPAIIGSDGKPERKVIAEMVFQNSCLRKRLEAIVHPVVFRKYREIIFDFKEKGGIIIFEVPLLFETGSENLFDKIIVVSAPPEVIISRQRQSYSEKEIKKRMEIQIPLEQKEKKASYVIFNSGSLSYTVKQTRKIINCMEQELTDN